jgi:hypothetical protein
MRSQTKNIKTPVGQDQPIKKSNFDDQPLPIQQKGSIATEFNVDDIPIQTKKLTFEELLAQNLINENSNEEEDIFGKQIKPLGSK